MIFAWPNAPTIDGHSPGAMEIVCSTFPSAKRTSPFGMSNS
jgi:hypothetical protein